MLSLLPLAGRNVWRRNHLRTWATIGAVATATIVFSAVMVIPFVIDKIISQGERSPRLVVINRASILYGLPDSYYRKVQEVPGLVAVSRMIWFGGVYDDPRRQFPTMALEADMVDLVWPEYG